MTRDSALPDLPIATSTEWVLLLNQALARLRQKRDVTQQEVATVAGLHVGTIGRIERGEVQGALQLRTITALATAFGCESLGQFWHQLQDARQGDTATAELRLDARARRVVLAFQELLPIQQDTAEAVVLWLLASARAHRTGQELLCTLDGLPVLPRRR